MDIKIIDFGYAKQLEHKKDIKITAQEIATLKMSSRLLGDQQMFAG